MDPPSLQNFHKTYHKKSNKTKQWLLAGEFSEFVLPKMVFLKNWSDSLNSPSFSNLVCSDSPDSRKPSFASKKRIWRVWRIQRVQARSFYTYKICNLWLKRPTFSWAKTWQVLARLADIRQALLRGLADIRQRPFL